MATLKELLRNPGPFITALLPNIQELVRLNNPYITNEAARLIFNKMLNWGGVVYSTDCAACDYNSSRSSGGALQEFNNGLTTYTKYPAQSGIIDKKYADSSLIKNLGVQLDSLPMNTSNAWLEYQKLVDVFYQLVDPITFFRLGQNQSECPPDLEPCANVNRNYYLQRIGIYERPLTTVGTEGTGFAISNPVKGDGTINHQVEIGFKAPYPSNGNHAASLNNRYFALNYDEASDNWDVLWYDYEGTGVEPVFTGGSGTITYYPIALVESDEWPEIQTKTTEAVLNTRQWEVLRECPPGVGCIWKHSSTYVAADNRSRSNAIDGTGGYATPVTTMKASDGTELATGLESDLAWQNAHNDMRVPYEKMTLDNDVMYLKSIGDLGDNSEDPCCEIPGAPSPCSACFVFLQTTDLGIIEDLPVNVPGVTRNNRTKANIKFVTD